MNRGRHSSSALRSRLAGRWVLAGLAAAGLLFAVHVHRYFFLNDDSYITFRYAHHVAQGLGPVWNPGERVEGYTSPAWLALMAVSLVLGVAPELSAPWLGIAGGIATLMLLWRYCRATAGAAAALLAVVSLCASRTFTAWCTGGLETMLFTLLISAAMLQFAREHDGAGPGVPSALLFALATLTRPEGVLFAAVAAAVVAAQVMRRRVSWRHALTWLLPQALLVGGHEIWRLWYYGELLPNTFHAKVAGVWLEQGARYFRLIHEDYGFGYFLPILVAAPFLKRRFDIGFFAAAIGLYLGYVAAVGGDRFEFRFIVPVLPLAVLVLAVGLEAAANLDRWLPRRVATRAAAAIGLAFVALTLIGSHRAEASKERQGVASIPLMRAYARQRADEGRFLRRLVERGLLRPDTVLAVGGAGALPYYSQLPVIDRRGLNDHYIARLPVEARGIIAHEHDAPLAYLRARGVVIFDVLNHIVHETVVPECWAADCDSLFEAAPRGVPGQEPGSVVSHDGTALPLLKVQADDRYLIFAAVQPIEEVLKSLPGLRVVEAQPPTAPLEIGSDPGRRPPNILLIVADDWGVENNALIGVSGAAPAIPNLAALAGQGMLFRQFWSGPSCAPSRVMYHSGRYTFRTLVPGGVGEFHLPLGELTIAEMLARAGYATATFGKWHLGNLSKSRLIPAEPRSRGYRVYSALDVTDVPWSHTDWPERRLDASDNEVVSPNTEFHDQYQARRLKHFVATAPEPWFANYQAFLPHFPFVCPPSELLKGEPCGGGDTDLAKHRDMVIAHDTLVGEILDVVDLSDTVVMVMMGDNGTPSELATSPCTSTTSKFTVFQCGIRNPLIVAGPGVPVGVSDALVAGVDIFATFAALSGQVPADGVVRDSISFAPLIGYGRPGESTRSLLYSEWLDSAGPFNPATKWQVAVRDDRFKFIRGSNIAPPNRLYDLRSDAFESKNLLPGPMTALQISRCKELAYYIKSLWDEDRLGEDSLDPEAICA